MRLILCLFLVMVTLPFSVSAQNDATECQAGDPNRESQLASHQIFFGLAENGIINRQHSELIIDGASVPDGTVGLDGNLWVYYVNGTAGTHGIFVSAQQADGTWQVQDCLKLDGVFNGNAVDPDIVRLDDGRYRLYYFEGYFVSPPPPDFANEIPHPIYSAISEDGINFEVEGLAFELPTITDPSVVQLPDGTWLMAMAYSGQTALAKSEDGLSFTAMNPIEDGGIPELSLDADGNVLLWGRSQWLSADGGLTWQITGAQSLNPDASIVWLDNGQLAFFYKDFDPADRLPSPANQPNGNPNDGSNRDLPPCPPPAENVTPYPCQPQQRAG